MPPRPLQCISSNRCLLTCSVHFDAQSAGKGEEIPLVKAAKTVFDNSTPSFWSLAAMVAPAFLLPVIRLLASTFPSKSMTESREAFETLYGASDALIEVGCTKLETLVAMHVCLLQLLAFANSQDEHLLFSASWVRNHKLTVCKYNNMQLPAQVMAVWPLQVINKPMLLYNVVIYAVPVSWFKVVVYYIPDCVRKHMQCNQIGYAALCHELQPPKG